MAHVASHPGTRFRWTLWPFGREHRSMHHVPFAELVHCHHLWRAGLERDGPGGELDHRYREARRHFEARHGPIVEEYWCWRVPSAAVLTAEPRGFASGPRYVVHAETDWATEGRPEIAVQMHRCDALAARSRQVLTGVRERICMSLVMASVAHMLSLVDARVEEDPAGAERRVSKALELARRALDKTSHYYHHAATGQAQVVYFTGMAIAVCALVALAVCGGIWLKQPHIDDREFYGCIASGAIGAVVSVIQRINAGRFDLEYDVGRLYVRFLGALRPILGAAFALAIYFAIASDTLNLFQLPKGGTTSRLYALLVIAFAAGFSERWAQDTLTSITQKTGQPQPPTPQEAKPTQ
jgi:hypothetical protein